MPAQGLASTHLILTVESGSKSAINERHGKAYTRGMPSPQYPPHTMYNTKNTAAINAREFPRMILYAYPAMNLRLMSQTSPYESNTRSSISTLEGPVPLRP